VHREPPVEQSANRSVSAVCHLTAVFSHRSSKTGSKPQGLICEKCRLHGVFCDFAYWDSVHGKDATKAAKRAVSDAIRHSSLSFVRLFGKTPQEMQIEVMIAVPNPESLDTAAVAKELPYGTVTVTAVKGGLEVPAEQGSDSILIANAAVIVSLDVGS
jgi:uncharacterized protein (TIGR02058 family)